MNNNSTKNKANYTIKEGDTVVLPDNTLGKVLYVKVVVFPNDQEFSVHDLRAVKLAPGTTNLKMN